MEHCWNSTPFEEYQGDKTFKMNRFPNLGHKGTPSYQFQNLNSSSETIGLQTIPQLISPTIPVLSNFVFSMAGHGSMSQRLRSNTGKIVRIKHYFSLPGVHK